jgi:hypothetical protein
MGERSAVEIKSGVSVSQSDPALRRPTSPATAGLKPEARPPIAQRKTVRGVGQSPTVPPRREALGSSVQSDKLGALSLDGFASESLSDLEINTVIQFFTILDRWDREAHETKIM